MRSDPCRGAGGGGEHEPAEHRTTSSLSFVDAGVGEHDARERWGVEHAAEAEGAGQGAGLLGVQTDVMVPTPMPTTARTAPRTRRRSS